MREIIVITLPSDPYENMDHENLAMLKESIQMSFTADQLLAVIGVGPTEFIRIDSTRKPSNRTWRKIKRSIKKAENS